MNLWGLRAQVSKNQLYVEGCEPYGDASQSWPRVKPLTFAQVDLIFNSNINGISTLESDHKRLWPSPNTFILEEVRCYVGKTATPGQ